MRFLLALLLAAALPAVAATVTLSSGAQVCTATQVVVTCAGDPPPQPPMDSCTTLVVAIYQEAQHRHPDDEGLAYWSGRCRAGMSETDIRAAFGLPPRGAPPSGCSSSAIQPVLAWGEIREQRAQSGQVMAFQVPAPLESFRSAVAITQGQQPAVPSGKVITEFQVSKCPGVIDPTPGRCSFRNDSGFVNNNGFEIYTKPLPQFGWIDQNTIPGCFAPASQGPWYLNVRWTYEFCAWGACGFSLQWSAGSW